MQVRLFTDGACSFNPGPGGWGALIHTTVDGVRTETELKGGQSHATNNAMELLGAIKGLEKVWETIQERQAEHVDLAVENVDVEVVSDSVYLVQGMNLWMEGWQCNGWKTANGSEVKNRDLFMRLFDLSQQIPQVRFSWVKGHSNHAENDRADALARSAIPVSPGLTKTTKTTKSRVAEKRKRES